jgi:hypothetical protein
LIRNRIFIVIIILAIILVAYLYLTTEFQMVSSTGMKRAAWNLEETYYFGHEMNWKGLVSPTISKIEVVRNNSNVVEELEIELMKKSFQ